MQSFLWRVEKYFRTRKQILAFENFRVRRLISINALNFHISHSNHDSHGSHSSHASHSSHTSHQNDAYHSNSLYSAEGDVAYGPTIWSVPGVNNQVTSGSSVPSLGGGAGGSYYGATTIGGTSSNGTSGHITGDSMLPNLTPYSGGEGVGVVSAPPVPDTIPIEDFGEVASE